MFASAALSLAMAAQPGLAANLPPARRTFVVAGHLPGWRFPSVPPEKLQGVTDLLIFSVRPTDRGEVDFGDLDMTAVRKYKEAKARIGYRMWICVGGWGRSAGFPAALHASATRTRLLDQLAYLATTEGFDGVTFDWENPKTPQEVGDYAAFLGEAKTVFTARRRLLGASLAPWVELPSSALAALDRVYLLSYDYQGQHSTVADAERDVHRLIRRGAPASKIVLGVPFYGRGVADWSQTKGYGEISRLFQPAPSQDEAGGFWYNGPDTIRRKVELARQNGLAGIVIWELGQDSSGQDSLLKAAAAAATATQGEPAPGPKPEPAGAVKTAQAYDKSERGNRRIVAPRTARRTAPHKTAKVQARHTGAQPKP